MLPAFAVIAELATSEEKRAMTSPLAVGVTKPSIVTHCACPAVAVGDVPLAVAGTSYALEWVCEVESVLFAVFTSGIETVNPRREFAGPLIAQREPVVVAAEVYQITKRNQYVPVVTGKDNPVTSAIVFATELLFTTSPESTTEESEEETAAAP